MKTKIYARCPPIFRFVQVNIVNRVYMALSTIITFKINMNNVTNTLIMKNNIFGMFFAIMSICMISCQSENDELLVKNEKTRNFLMNIVRHGQKYATEPIVITRAITSNASRKVNEKDCLDDESSYIIGIDFPAETEDFLKKYFDNAQTIEDLIELRRLTNAVYTYGEDVQDPESIIEVSREEVLNIMDPMIEMSKKFLIEEKDFSEDEIQEMLEENDADESQLVPLVMLICEDEVKLADLPEIDDNHNNNLLPTPRYAPKSTGNHVLDCAIKAIGADVLVSAAQSGLKTWSKELIKKSFKVIAKRALGPIGAAIALVEFALCL